MYLRPGASGACGPSVSGSVDLVCCVSLFSLWFVPCQVSVVCLFSEVVDPGLSGVLTLLVIKCFLRKCSVFICQFFTW